MIRAAVAKDIPAVLALWEEAAAEPTVTDDAEALRLLLDHNQSALLLAVENGLVVGSVIAGWDGWRGNLYRLAVRPSHRRQGIAGRLVGAAEDWLAGRGARRIHAGVLGTYPSAVGFWEALGYDYDKRIFRYRKDGDRP